MAPDPPPAKRRRSDEITADGYYSPPKQQPAFFAVAHAAAATTSNSQWMISLPMNQNSVQAIGSRPLDVRPIRELKTPDFLASSWPVLQGREVKYKGFSVEKEESPLIVFAHGGGAPSTSRWMLKWKEMIRDALNAVDVVTFDYPYVSGKRKGPPKPEKLVDHHVNIVKDAVAKYPGHPLILMGKSMGSRVSCMVAGADGIDVSAVVCLGYPLKGIKGVLRDGTLLQLRAPTLFVQGGKDCLCPLDKLELTRRKMSCRSEVYVIEGGDHSFQIGKKFQESSGMSQEQAERAAVTAIAAFVSRIIREI